MDATIYDIAKAAQVSVYTALRALNGTTKGVRRDAQERAKRVQAIAKSMNYHPSDAARSLATSKTGNLGFILASEVEGGIGNQYYAQLLSGVEKVCRKNGYGLHFGIGSMLEIGDFVYPKAVAGRSVDGIFIAGSTITSQVVEQFERLDIPCLCFSHCEIDSEKIIRVNRDISSFKKLFAYALDCGHKRIGIVELESEGIRKRRQNMEKWLAGKGMEYISLPMRSTCVEDVADEVIEQHLALPPPERPTVIASFPYACMAMIDKLARRDVKCPDEISFIAWGADGFNRYFHPQLAYLDFATQEFGALATEAMISHLQHGTPLRKMDIAQEVTFHDGESLKKLNLAKG